MDIPALSMNMAQSSIQSDVGVAMLSKSLDTYQDTGENVAKMLEQSVNPAVGGNIDISL